MLVNAELSSKATNATQFDVRTDYNLRFLSGEGNMGLKKFRKIRAQDEEYINVSVVCSNYGRTNYERDSLRIDHEIGGSNSTIGSHSGYITSPRCACTEES